MSHALPLPQHDVDSLLSPCLAAKIHGRARGYASVHDANAERRVILIIWHSTLDDAEERARACACAAMFGVQAGPFRCACAGQCRQDNGKYDTVLVDQPLAPFAASHCVC
jgi:hypothetical protein